VLNICLYRAFGQTVAEIWPFFDFSRWQPSAILDLLYAWWSHKQRVFVGICQCAKFGCIRCSSFDSCLILCALGLKCVFTTLKSGFLVFHPQYGEQYQRDPKTALPCAETRHMTLKSVHGYELCAINSNSTCFPVGRTTHKNRPLALGDLHPN